MNPENIAVDAIKLSEMLDVISVGKFRPSTVMHRSVKKEFSCLKVLYHIYICIKVTL